MKRHHVYSPPALWDRRGSSSVPLSCCMPLHICVMDSLHKPTAGTDATLWGGRVRYGLARFFDGDGAGLSRLLSSAAGGTTGEAPSVLSVVGGVVVRCNVRVCTCSGRVWSAVSTGTNR